MDSVRIGVALTCKNAALTIKYSLLSVLKQSGVDLSVVIVDSYSNDSTDIIALETLRKFNIPYRIVKRKSNIAEGRNIAFKLALDFDPDYVLSFDADVILKYKNLLKSLSEISSGKRVIYAAYEHITLRGVNEVYNFCEKLIKKLEFSFLKKSGLNYRKSKWCGLGATLLPRKLVELVELNPNLSFAEDRQFGFLCWKHKFPILWVTYGKDLLSLDVNLQRGKLSNIYLGMGIREYLRGISDKILWSEIWQWYEGSFIRTLRNFLFSPYSRAKRHAFHIIIDALIAYSLLSLPSSPLLSLSIFMMIISTLLGWGLKKGLRISEIPKQFIKFNIYSLTTLLLFIPSYIKHRGLLQEAYKVYNLYSERIFS